MSASDRESRLREEMLLHIEMAAEANIRNGMTPEAARRAARLAFGATEQFKEEARDQFRNRYLAMIRQDCRYALRSARRSWGYTAIVIATFALGIGANTAMFTLVNTVLISPLPYAEPDRLVLIMGKPGGISAPDFLDFRSHNTVFSSLALWGGSQATLSGQFDPEEVASTDISTGFLATIGVRPLLGRDFTADEEANPGNAVILSSALWQRRYGGDRAIVGHAVVIDGRSTTVVGIAPPELDRTLAGDIYRPFDFHAPHATVRAYRTQPVVARLRPEVSLAAAQAAMNTAAQQLGSVYPEDFNHTIMLRPYQETLIGNAGSQLLYLLAAVVVVLLIACGNVASLMLARSTARQGELATRVALGASRARLAQQLVTESTLMAILGGAIGFLLAAVLLHTVERSGATGLPRMAELGLSPVSFLFTVLLALAAGTIVGAASAWRATASAANPSLSVGGRGSHSRASARIREVVVTLQLVASLILLTSASVMLASFWRLAHVSRGFDDRDVLTGTVFMPADRYSFSGAVDWWSDAVKQLGVMPHVKSVTAASQIPFAPGGNGSYTLPGIADGAGNHPSSALINVIGDHYFETMRIPIVSGAGFSQEGTAGQIREVMISESVAKKISPFGTAVGRQLTFPDFGGFTGQVVGVVGDVRANLGREAPDIIYFPLKQMGGWARSMYLLVRTDDDPLTIVPSVRRLVAQRDPLLAVGRVRTMSDIIGRSVSRQRLEAIILAAFGGVALLLAALGLYGLLAYAVATRTHEFSIRLALGAQRGQLFRSVVRNGMRLVVIGLGAGIALIPMLLRVLRSAFVGTVVDGNAIAASVVVLALIGLCACVIPAVRATRVGPILARPD